MQTLMLQSWQKKKKKEEKKEKTQEDEKGINKKRLPGEIGKGFFSFFPSTNWIYLWGERPVFLLFMDPDNFTLSLCILKIRVYVLV